MEQEGVKLAKSASHKSQPQRTEDTLKVTTCTKGEKYFKGQEIKIPSHIPQR